MCRAVHVRLNEEERKRVANWTGVLAPVYASIAVLLVGAVLFGAPTRGGKMTANAEIPIERANPQE